MTGTERSVVKPLEVPAWQSASSEEQAVAAAENASAQSSAARSSIEDFLGQVARRPAAGPSPETANSSAPALAEADRCPHCGSRLSSLDYKFNRCLSCGKPPVLALAADGEPKGSEAWTVRL
ncbi:hypothetical protein IT575_11650 [bacterium]|nr:hypothetical protein [bacterium]